MPENYLPPAYFPRPECGHCFDSVEWDGDGYRCESCRLYWPDGGLDDPAEFLDDDEPVCGKPCAPLVTFGGKHCRQLECVLPESHTSSCLRPWVRIDDTEATNE